MKAIGYGYTTRQIAAELTRHGLTTRRGTPWRFQYVAQALRTGRVSQTLTAAA